MEALNSACQRLRPLAEYASRLPSSQRGKRLNRATLWRWALHGVRGRRLRTVTLGGGRMSCDAWVCEFLLPAPRDRRLQQVARGLDPLERDRIAGVLGAPTGRRTG